MTLLIKEIEKGSSKEIKTWELSNITSMSQCLELIKELDKALSRVFHKFVWTIVE